MDWRNRGYLLKVDVERYCTQALAGASSVIKNDRLLDIIKSSDSNRDGRIDRDEFVHICRKVEDIIFQRRTERLTEIANPNGARETRLERKWLHEARSEYLPISDEWSIVRSSTGEVIEYLNHVTGYISKLKPVSDPRKFSDMVFTAARVVMPRLSYFMECLESRNPPKELKASCETVLESCSIYEDDFMERKIDLPMFRNRSYELLRNTQGFLWSLGAPRLKAIFGRFDSLTNVPLPILYAWEDLLLPHRAELIILESTALRQLLKGASQRRNELFYSLEIQKQSDILRKSLIDMRTLQFAERMLPKKPNVRFRQLKVTGIKKRNMTTGLKKDTGLMKSQLPLTYASIDVVGKVPITFDTQYCEGTEPQWTLDMNVFLDKETTVRVYLYDKKSGLIKDDFISIYSMDDPCDWNSVREEQTYGGEVKMTLVLEKVPGAASFRDVWADSVDSCFVTSYPCPSNWEEETTGADHRSFRNTETGSTTVALPTPINFDMNGLQLPDGWERVKMGRSNVKYFNTKTGDCQECSPMYQGEKVQGSGEPAKVPTRRDYLLFELSPDQLADLVDEESWRDINGELLPAGWGRRQTERGRVFYCDHNTKTTTWASPLAMND